MYCLSYLPVYTELTIKHTNTHNSNNLSGPHRTPTRSSSSGTTAPPRGLRSSIEAAYVDIHNMIHDINIL